MTLVDLFQLLIVLPSTSSVVPLKHHLWVEEKERLVAPGFSEVAPTCLSRLQSNKGENLSAKAGFHV